MESEGRRLHSQAAQLRESGKIPESVHAVDDALLAYDADNDSLGFAEGLACRSISLRVYANEHESRRLLLLAKYEMMAAVEVAKESSNPQALALPQFNLAKLQEELGEFETAVATYKEAIQNMERFPLESHNRPSVLLDMKIHLSTAEYKNGDIEARERLESYLAELENTDEKKFNKDVWVTGGYMRLAEIYHGDDKQKAREYLDKAEAMSDANPELMLRKQQIGKLKESLFS